MRKAILAGILAAVTIGTACGGIASFSASQDDAQLQISDEQKETSEDTTVEEADEDAQSDAQETELPLGKVLKADLADMTDAAAMNSGVAEVAEYFCSGSDGLVPRRQFPV